MRSGKIWISIFLLLPFWVSAQSMQLKGTIIDKDMRETLPFASISVPQSNDGFIANEDGEFNITIPAKTDSVIFTYLGFSSYTLHLPVPDSLMNDSVSLLIEMEEFSSELEQIVVYAPKRRKRDKPAWRIYNNVVDNKKKNKPTAHDYFEQEEYIKTVASFYNFSPKLLNRKIIRPFKFVLENYDSTSDGRLYVPLILKEDIKQHYYQKKPKKERSITVSQKVSGIEQAQISNLLDVALDQMDAYSSELVVSTRSFMMPFAEGAWFKYRFYVIDSMQNDLDEWIYHLGFSPAIKGELAFLGEAWIHAPTYAIQKMTLRVDKAANINWLNDFTAEQEFKLIDGKHWVLAKDVRTSGIAFTQRKKSKMVHIEQVRSYDKIKINEPIADSIFKDNSLYAEGYRKRSDEYWDENRHDELSTSQNNVYFLIDSLKSTKAYHRYMNFGRTVASGYYKAGPIDIGNIWNAISKNPVEGYRFRLTLRNNKPMSNKVYYRVYGAYGLKDKRFKYGGEVSYKFPHKNYLYNELGIRYTDDYERFTLDNKVSNDHDYILNSLFRKGGYRDLIYVRNLSVFNKKEWNATFTTNLSANYKRYKTLPDLLEFTSTKDDGTQEVIKGFNMFHPEFNLEITPGASFIRTDERRIYLKGKLPRFNLNYTFSKKGFLGSDFTFQSVGMSMDHILPSPIGKTKYILSASKMFGDIPYPLLTIHQGNESFLFMYNKFSNMREGEFAADQQVSLLLEHNFEGFFLNKIPLLKKAQLREVFMFKMAYSSLDKNKTSFLDMPSDMKGLDGFYSEIGFGIHNILKMFQVQFSWRLTQRDHPDVNNFAVKFWISPDF